ncbi:MAG: EpsG family protein [Ruthenibacterium sp.]
MPVYLVMTALATVLAFFACRVRAGLPAEPSAVQLVIGRDTRSRALRFWALAIGSALPYVLVAGFRYYVGTDYGFTYEPLIRRMLNGVPFDEMIVEPGYWALCRLLSSLGLGITWLMLISAIFITLFFWLAFYEQSDIPWLSVFLFAGTRHFFISMNVVRQYMAMALVLFGFRFIREKCFWKYALCVGVAMLFHTSALFLLPLYFLRYLKIHPLVGGGLLALTYVLKAPLMELLRFVVGKTSYAWYLTSVWADVPPTYPQKLLALLPIVLIASVYYFLNGNRDKPMFRVGYACLLGVVFFALNRNIIPLTDRLSHMLEMTQLLFVPMLLHGEKRKWLRVLLGVLMIGSILWLTYFEIFQNGYHEVQLYRCVFFPEIAFQW